MPCTQQSIFTARKSHELKNIGRSQPKSCRLQVIDSDSTERLFCVVMNKREMAKELWGGFAYLVTGVALIIGTLVGLGIMIESLAQPYTETTMPTLVSLIPLLVTLVGVAWGGYFIWKACMGPAPGLAFYLIGKAGYKMFGLHRVRTRRRKGIAALIILIALVVFCVEIIPASIKAGFDPLLLEPRHLHVALISVLVVILGMAIGGYDPEETTQYG